MEITNKQYWIDRLKQCDSMGIEDGHHEADNILLELIGDDDIRREFEELDRWYT